MSTLTEKIADALEGHIFDKPIGRCRCNAPMDTTGHRTREHRTHLAEITAAVVAEWLGSDETIRAAEDRHPKRGGSCCFECGRPGHRCPPPVTSQSMTAALAAEAVKGAGQ